MEVKGLILSKFIITRTVFFQIWWNLHHRGLFKDSQKQLFSRCTTHITYSVYRIYLFYYAKASHRLSESNLELILVSCIDKATLFWGENSLSMWIKSLQHLLESGHVLFSGTDEDTGIQSLLSFMRLRFYL